MNEGDDTGHINEVKSSQSGYAGSGLVAVIESATK